MTEKKARILIVDDQASARELLKGFLFPEGYELAFASSGFEALAHLSNFKPDTLLLDVMMPDMDGFEVCRRLKADERWSHVPIILVTALDNPEDLVRGFEAGADDFLHKPVKSLELRVRVRSMVRIKKQFDQLQASLKLREDMAAMIVHDMRSPLTPILGISELLLLRTEFASEFLKDIKTIHTQAHRLNAFLNDMLILAKIDGGKLTLYRSAVDVNQLILSVKENYHLMAESREINFILDLPPQPQPMLLDANLFQRVLENLISNALKFSPRRGAVTISLAYALPDQRPRLQLIVRDEGPGVPEAYRDKIFDKFNIVDLNQRDITQVGLGLAFCKLVVEAHGGRIFVEANRPTGSVFVVEV